MGGKTAITAGLLTGLVAGGLMVGALVAYGPGAVAPTPPVAQASPPPAASEEPSPSASVPASPASPGSPDPAPSSDGAFGVGEAAPALVVPQLGGGTISLAALRGQPVWVNFMATWCPPCRDEMPRMNGYAARYAEQGLVVIAIDVREDEAQVDAFAKELGLVFPVGLDTDGAAQARWGALALPVHFWIDAEGIVRDGALGGIGPDIMAQGLQTILPGVTVTP
jgi:cytochrome c biogenesis protein CcmG, thiol:disulfide interchange protein DsbE